MFLNKKELPHDVQKVLVCLALNLAPPVEQLNVEGIMKEIVYQSGRLIFEFPKLFQWGLCIGIRFFNYFPFFFGFGASRFVHLSLSDQKKYVDKWSKCPVVPIREFFKTLKALVLLVYFSDKRVWQYIGYDPSPHLKERISLRQTVLKRDGIAENYLLEVKNKNE